jgi:hypothetical protein
MFVLFRSVRAPELTLLAGCKALQYLWFPGAVISMVKARNSLRRFCERKEFLQHVARLAQARLQNSFSSHEAEATVSIRDIPPNEAPAIDIPAAGVANRTCACCYPGIGLEKEVGFRSMFAGRY